MANKTTDNSSQVLKPKNRIFPKIPVFVTENHNDVLEIILPSLANRYLPFEKNVLIHFDSHPDMCQPRTMPAKTVFDRKLLLESLSIENWILPLMYAKHLNKMVWIRPSWANQIPNGNHNFLIGESKDDLTIRLNSKLDYFLSDGGYADESKLQNTNQIEFEVVSTENGIQYELSDESSWILDIDLDYFSTLNPFLDIYPKADTYKKLKEIFKIEKNYDKNDPESVLAYVGKRNRMLDFFETIFEHMAVNGSLKKFKFEDQEMKPKFELLENLIECLCHNYSIHDIDWFVVNNAGCVTDDEEHELPHHESSDQTISEMILQFENFIKSFKKPPTLITIARSSIDGYTPKHQVEIIQTKVMQSLSKVYGENLSKNPTLWYKNSSDKSALEQVLMTS